MEGTVNFNDRSFDVTNLPDETDRLLTIDQATVRWLWKQNGTLVMLSKPHTGSLGVSNGQNLVVGSKVDDAGRGGLLAPVNTEAGRFVARSLVDVSQANIQDFDHVQLADGSYLARIPVRIL
jgi:hypothetical protein